ncbi:MAG: V-type ATP synthase subunit E [Lachnospiraceae bacterium]|nr:V-type ATP synthase subunit E [Lachnospiraceae bacterium]
MAGIDNITGRILEEAKAESDAIIARANGKALDIGVAAADEIKKAKKASDERIARDTKTYEARTLSSCDILKKKAILSAKQEIIEDVVKKAFDRLLSQDTDAYFDMILGVVRKALRPEAGTAFLAAGDLERLPKDFAAKLAAAAKEAGGTLSLSSRPAPIEHGCILSYGGIEENCSLAAIFEANKDRIQDAAAKVLFS